MDQDPGASIDARLEPVTLATVADGQLETQFQERLFQALEVLRDFKRLTESGKSHSVTIPLEVIITRWAESGHFSIACRANAIKPPKPRALVRAAFQRGDGLKIEPEAIQQPLEFPRAVNGDVTDGES
jgi:hypothetical protein